MAEDGIRLAFLKTVVETSEGHLRATDTKAQIALAAFVLSWNPLLAMFGAGCARGVAHASAAALAAALVVTVVAYGRAVWPSSVRAAGRGPSLFYVDRATVPTARDLLDRLAAASLLEALADEVLKLSELRQRKTRRLTAALACSLVAYALYVALLLARQHCG